MTQLTGHEASVLAFIARHPKSSEAARLAESLDGRAKKIANALVKGTRTDASSSAAAKAMRSWAVAGS